jgi:hypothetical protein
MMTVETRPEESPLGESPTGMYSRKRNLIRERSGSKEEFRNVPRLNQVCFYT